MWQTDGHSDRKTDTLPRHSPRYAYASRGKNCLLDDVEQMRTMNVIKSHLHDVYTEEVNKVALSAQDDKRVIMEDGIHTSAYGHYRLKLERYWPGGSVHMACQHGSAPNWVQWGGHNLYNVRSSSGTGSLLRARFTNRDLTWSGSESEVNRFDPSIFVSPTQITSK